MSETSARTTSIVLKPAVTIKANIALSRLPLSVEESKVARIFLVLSADNASFLCPARIFKPLTRSAGFISIKPSTYKKLKNNFAEVRYKFAVAGEYFSFKNTR